MKWLVFVVFLWPVAAAANDWAALDQPGAIAIMRHALAPGTGDPAGFELGDCSTQRILNDAGRQQARSIGDAFRARGIVFDHVFTGQWCRTRETAELLGLGPVTEAPALNSFFGDVSTRDSQTQATRALIEDQRGRVFLVTHQVNISALTGEFTRSGEVLVIRAEAGGIEVLGSILIEP
ncbi:MAG: histidine phosphatase family protein [Hoeflea sp.]|uniref:histidine phosphatase family protein n=1 Tax=Hoeflea sp. TaxID=1940281 RepID=UPI001D9CCB69|nr:histidine phosphatase family protein [Hoeflea sp.]MBU4531305.1 histidine phosphatase family protein [Alphaproteobacteria bacterium]MBU4544162.1 histidine phosphatase family protein [Alphaproteobacteria bacterium]MBU4550601.1 histidine phosphatase family protein [Alphaproteobacteria bacterium]MBV1724582.1 histidine phosphatase family protein [Hoeflea sp.]MBV1760602.1 histidine phosphatase family protein [Hoeflea sp.]